MHRAPTIAGVILTLNEEQDLARALRSLAWCDELFVIDSGSTDHTLEVAEECGAKFVQHIQTPPFIITEQRNWALRCAGICSDWVLFLDADEQVGEVLAHEIRQCIASHQNLDAYELTPRYWFLGQWLKRTQGYPNWHPRLLRKGRTEFCGGVWESFSQGTSVGKILTPYEHYAFSKGFDDWLERHRRYATWDAAEIIALLHGTELTSFKTHRWRRARALVARLWILRPLLRFVQKYFLQLGMLEGWRAFLFCLLMSFYDLMTVVKVIETKRQQQNLPL